MRILVASLLLLFVCTVSPNLGLAQVCHTFDFLSDEDSWIWDDCGVVNVGDWTSYPDGINIIDISSTEIYIADLEGGNCSNANDGGDNQNFWTSIDIDVSGKCQLEIEATYSLDNPSIFPPGNWLECNCGCDGEDYLGFEYSVDGGSWQLFDPTTPNELCTNDRGTGHTLTTAIISGASTIAIRIQLAAQSVSEAIVINSVEIIEVPVTLAVDADAIETNICDGQDIMLTESGGDADQWNWNGPNGYSSSMQNPTVSGSDLPGVGTYTYEVIITDTNGCTDTDDVQLTVSAGFDATLTTAAGGDVLICEGDCATNDYIIEFSVSGGTPPYDITLGGLPFPIFIPDLPTNFIQICEGPVDVDPFSDPLQITVPAAFFDFQLELLSAIDDNGCVGNINGGFIDVMLQSTPSINDPVVMEECLAPGETIDLRQYDNEIGGGEEVIWLQTQDVTDVIGSPSAYDITDGNPVYAVVYLDPCYSDIREIMLESVIKPVITITQSPLYSCGNEYVLPDFDEVATIENGSNPQYYLDSGLTQGPHSASFTVAVNYGSNNIYIYDESSATCFAQESFELIALQAPEIVSPSGLLEECGEIILPVPIIDNQDNLVYGYFTGPDGSGTEYIEGDPIEESDGVTLLYLIAINNEGTPEECIDTTWVHLSFLGGTSYSADIPAQICDTLFLPQIIPAAATVAYYNSVPAGRQYLPGDTISYAETQSGTNPLDTLYLYDPTQTGACATVDTLVFELGNTPILAVPFQTMFCESGILPPPSTNNPNLEYATTPDFQPGTILNPNLTITTSTQIYLRDSFAFANGGACYAYEDFFLEIVSALDAGQDATLAICQGYSEAIDLWAVINPDAMTGSFEIEPAVLGIDFSDPANFFVDNIATGSYEITYTLNVQNCMDESTVILDITDAPVIPVLSQPVITTCDPEETFNLMALLGNPDLGGSWIDVNNNPLLLIDSTDVKVSDYITDPANPTVTFIYSFPTSNNNPFCDSVIGELTFELIDAPFAGIDTTITLCQGYDEGGFDLAALLSDPDSGGSYAVIGNVPDLDVSTPSNTDLSILAEGSYQIIHTIEKLGCTMTEAYINIEVIAEQYPGVNNSYEYCNETAPIDLLALLGEPDLGGTLTVEDDAGQDYPVFDPRSFELGALPFGNYSVNYRHAQFNDDPYCEATMASVTLLHNAGQDAGSNSEVTICEGQAIDLNSLLSSEANAGGVFTQDGFPVSDPINWTPITTNNQVNIKYLLASSSASCPPDSSSIIVNISTTLSAGMPATDNLVCNGETILLSDYIDDETPGGSFYLSSDLTTPIPDSYIPLLEEALSYIIPGAPGCDPDTTMFSLSINNSISASVSYSTSEICADDTDCILLFVDSNVDGEVEVLVSGDSGNQESSAFLAPVINGQTTFYFCPSNTFSTGGLSQDTFYMGTAPEIEISISNISDNSAVCSSLDLGQVDKLFIYSDFSFELDTTVCLGESVIIDGNSYVTSFSTSDFTTNGCDSTVTLTLSNYDPVEENLAADLCIGQSYNDIPGFSFTANLDTTIILTGASAAGCDSTINLSLRFENTAIGRIERTLCTGSSIEIGGITFDETNMMQEIPFTGGSVFGCDSATVVIVDFYPPSSIGMHEEKICDSGTYLLGDMTYDAVTTSGVSTLIGATENGCDSMVAVTIIIEQEEYPYQADLCANDTLFIGGDSYHADRLTGRSTTTEPTTTGCDSTLIVDLNLITLGERTITQELCENQSFVFNGTSYSSAKPQGTEFLTNTLGCDSIFYISVIELPSSATNIDIELCMDTDTVVNGVTYNSGTLMGATILNNAIGCDSTIFVSLAIREPSTDFFSEICAGDDEGTITLTDFSGLNFPVELSITGIAGSQTITSLPYIIGGIEVNRNYTINLDDGTCSLSEDISIQESNSPSLTISTVALGNNTFQLGTTSSIVVDSYEWSPSTLLDCSACPDPIASITREENITVIIISDQGCSYEYTTTLTPEEVIIPEQDTSVRIYLPNMINPSEELNQIFYPQSDVANFTVDALHIYDRWGNKVFENRNFPTNTEAEGWDGRRGGIREVEQGVYVYVLEYTDLLTGSEIRQGTITVFR